MDLTSAPSVQMNLSNAHIYGSFSVIDGILAMEYGISIDKIEFLYLGRSRPRCMLATAMQAILSAFVSTLILLLRVYLTVLLTNLRQDHSTIAFLYYSTVKGISVFLSCFLGYLIVLILPSFCLFVSTLAQNFLL